MARRKASVSSERTIYTYVYLYRNARLAVELAEASEEGRFYHCMNAIVSCAFCLEAYLNHLGGEKVRSWIFLEKLNPKEKLGVIAQALDFTPDLASSPFQSFQQIFKFRNTLAHGRTEHIKDQHIQELVEHNSIDYPETEWEKQCTIRTARRLFTDTVEMVTALNKAAVLGDHPFILFSYGTGSADIIE